MSCIVFVGPEPDPTNGVYPTLSQTATTLCTHSRSIFFNNKYMKRFVVSIYEYIR